jgi:hypothetical protein
MCSRPSAITSYVLDRIHAQPVQVTIISSACILCLIAYLFFSNRSVYLVNFSCYKPAPWCGPLNCMLEREHALDDILCQL